MRCTLLLLSFTAASSFAGGRYGEANTPVTSASHHIKMEVEANQLGLPVRVVLRGKDRAALDARLDAIKATLEKRFENQDGWDVRELDFDYARPVTNYGTSSASAKSTLWGDGEDKGDTTYEAAGSWLLLTQAEKGSKGLEILRLKAADLVKPKTEGEKQTIGDPQFRLSDAEGFRDELLDAIKTDFEEVKKHLPGNGEYRLQLPNLEKPVRVSSLGGRHYLLELPYNYAYTTPEPEKPKK